MAGKAKLFNDKVTLSKILRATEPMSIKRLGRQVRGFDGTAWDSHKYELVVQGNRLKFGQNPRLMQVLKSTSGKTLVEAAANDRVWGIGISVEDACRGVQWRGENLLGKALMVVRDVR